MLRIPRPTKPLRLGLIASYDSMLLLLLAQAFKKRLLPHVIPTCGVITRKTQPAEVGMNEIVSEPERRIIIAREDCTTVLEFNKKLIQYLRTNPVDLIVSLDELVPDLTTLSRFMACPVVRPHPAPLDYPYPDFSGDGLAWIDIQRAVIDFSHRVQRPTSIFHTEVNAVSVEDNRVLETNQVLVAPDDDALALFTRVMNAQVELLVWVINMFAELGEAKPNRVRHTRLIRPDETGAYCAAMGMVRSSPVAAIV